MPGVGVIILAAGESKRLGWPKQLLAFDGKTLLRRAAETALASTCWPVVVVLGSRAKELEAELAGLTVEVARNSQWEKGMSSSIRVGLEAISGGQNAEEISAVMIMLCDQPLVSAELLNQLVAKQRETGAGMVACEYGGTVGVPALFDERYFEALRALTETEGAKTLLKRNAGELEKVPFPKGDIDIDTCEDYERLLTSVQ